MNKLNTKSLSKFISKKVILLSLLTISLITVAVLFSSNLFAATTITSNQTGYNNGYYYSFWNQGGGNVSMTLGNGGNYSTSWSNCSNFTAGKGWATGSANKVVSYTGSINCGNNGYLALYGWTKNALIEYYVIETYGAWTPPGGQSSGTMTSDGGTYNVYRMTRTNQPSIIGTATFYQYFSVRTSKRSSGTVTFANHVNAWRSKGWNLGSTWDYVIMETEGYQSSGYSNITVSEGSAATATATPANTPAAQVGSTVQAENMTKSGQYTSNVSSPFTGVALYGNNDTISTAATFSGTGSITCRGASSNTSAAQVSLYIGSNKVGTFSFTGTSAANQTINFNASGTQTVKLVMEADTGSWDAYIDYITVGSGSTATATPSAAPVNTPAAQVGSTVQAENMTKSGQYTANVSSPFSGVALYGNNDSISTSANFTGTGSITCRGASSNSSAAQVSLYIGSNKVGTFSFTGTSATDQTVNFNTSGTQTVKLVMETDNGSWDAYIDYITVGSGSATIATATPAAPAPTATATPAAVTKTVATIQAENMTKSGQYTGNVTKPFTGVALYGNGDTISTTANFAGSGTLTCRGASSNTSAASVSVYIGNTKVGTLSFTGTTAATKSLTINASGSQTVKLVMETDTGKWDAFIDYIALK